MARKKLTDALGALNQRIAKGEEFPDAAWKVSCDYAVKYEDLADAYDEAQWHEGDLPKNQGFV